MWKEHGSKIVIIALLVLIVGLPLVIRPSDAGLAVQGEPAGSLVIYTPHNEQIRFEMERGFNDWREAQGLGPVLFDWRASGGTSDLRKTVLSQFAQLAKSGQEDQGIGADLFFGGGEYDHGQIKKGVTVSRNGDDVNISASVPLVLDQTMMAEVYPSPLIGGEKLYDAQYYWLGTALSSFGIVYNRDVLDMLEVPEPTRWQDLTDPKYQNFVALADPGHSGSIAATYHAILQRLGWEEGWKVLRRVFANARYFASGSNKVPVDVSSGDAAAGMCIDFYGRYQAGAVHFDLTRPSRVGYVDPYLTVGDRKVSITATTADPISLLRGAPNRDLAEQFVTWTLSKEAQQLWQRKLASKLNSETRAQTQTGDPINGPVRYELRRMPIRRDLYTADEKTNWADPEITPFETASPLAKGIPNYFSSVAPVTKAMAIDVHDDLVAAWQTIAATPEGPKKQKMLDLFDAMPPQLQVDWPSEDIAENWAAIIRNPDDPRNATVVETLADFKNKLRGDRDATHMDKLKQKLEWTLFFRDNYRRIVEMGNE